MKYTFKSFYPMIMILVSAAFFLAASRLNEPEATMKAGAAVIKITPAEPVRMSGYAARTEPFKGVHDDLFANAVIFENGRSSACIITADVIGFSHDFVDEIRKRINASTGIPVESILVTAVHNHGGPRTRAYGEKPTREEKKYQGRIFKRRRPIS